MRSAANVVLLIALGVFAVFVTNVAMGANGIPVFLNDVAEMLTLFAACIAFVAGVLLRERLETTTDNPSES